MVMLLILEHNAPSTDTTVRCALTEPRLGDRHWARDCCMVSLYYFNDSIIVYYLYENGKIVRDHNRWHYKKI